MFVFFGTRNSHLKTSQVTATCPHCHVTGPHTVSVYGEYAHVFWIPTFPMSKSGLVRCEHCLATYTNQTVPPALKKQVQLPGVADAPTPGWHWIGLGLFGLLVLFSVVWVFLDAPGNSGPVQGGQFGEFRNQKAAGSTILAELGEQQQASDYVLAAPDAQRRALAANPRVGDEYTIQPPKTNHFLRTQYTLQTVTETFVTGRMTLATPNSTTGKDSLLASYDKQFSRAALIEMEKTGLILFIYRR